MPLIGAGATEHKGRLREDVRERERGGHSLTSDAERISHPREELRANLRHNAERGMRSSRCCRFHRHCGRSAQEGGRVRCAPHAPQAAKALSRHLVSRASCSERHNVSVTNLDAHQCQPVVRQGMPVAAVRGLAYQGRTTACTRPKQERQQPPGAAA
eukprot:4212950-Prymnesium_polylepis.1